MWCRIFRELSSKNVVRIKTTLDQPLGNKVLDSLTITTEQRKALVTAVTWLATSLALTCQSNDLEIYRKPFNRRSIVDIELVELGGQTFLETDNQPNLRLATKLHLG